MLEEQARRFAVKGGGVSQSERLAGSLARGKRGFGPGGSPAGVSMILGIGLPARGPAWYDTASL